MMQLLPTEVLGLKKKNAPDNYSNDGPIGCFLEV